MKQQSVQRSKATPCNTNLADQREDINQQIKEWGLRKQETSPDYKYLN